MNDGVGDTRLLSSAVVSREVGSRIGASARGYGSPRLETLEFDPA